MSQMNVARKALLPVKTHEGGAAVRSNALGELRRTVMTALLWEKSFYESGEAVAARIKRLVPLVKPEDAMNLAVEARTEMYLRHVPLLIMREMARASSGHKKLLPFTMQHAMNRPDEMTEFLTMYWEDNDGKKTLAASVKRGLAAAFAKFNLFQLAKWDRKGKPVRLRDVMFLSHAKPTDATNPVRKWTKDERKLTRAAQARDWPFSAGEAAFSGVAQDELKQEGTWEDRMSAGEDAKVVFSDLMKKAQLGGMAFIRNLRKMDETGVDRELITDYGRTVNLRGILPFQLLTAARVNPQYEGMLDAMMLRSVDGMAKLPGRTVILVDVSGSMDQALARSVESMAQRAAATKRGVPFVEGPKRIDAACGVAIMARELCEDVSVFTFSDDLVAVPARRGMTLRDAVVNSQVHRGTALGAAVRSLHAMPGQGYDRIIVVTDEQSRDALGKPLNAAEAYVMNVAQYQQYGVGNASNGWTTISGWSPQVLRYIHETEKAAEAK